MTPSAQTALVNGAGPAQAFPRTTLHVVKPSSGADLVAAEQAATAFLAALGVDLDTESLAATPGRMARAYAEMFTPRLFDLTTFPNDAGYDELIIARSIPVQSVCQHARSTPTILPIQRSRWPTCYSAHTDQGSTTMSVPVAVRCTPSGSALTPVS
jgi:hypothetical protein